MHAIARGNCCSILVLIILSLQAVHSWHDYSDEVVNRQEMNELLAEIESLEEAAEDMAKVTQELEVGDATMQTTSKFNCKDSSEAFKMIAKLPKAEQEYYEGLMRKYVTRLPADVYCHKTVKGVKLHNLMKMADSMLEDINEPIFNKKKRLGDHKMSFAHGVINKGINCRERPFNEWCTKDRYVCERNDRDSEMILLRLCPEISEIWSSWTPCLYCQWSLMDWKVDKHRQEAVSLYVGKWYYDHKSDQKQNAVTDKSTNAWCFSMMKGMFFNLKPWDWELFRRQAQLKGACSEVVDLILACHEFEKATNKIKKQLNSLIEPKKARGLCNKPHELKLPFRKITNGRCKSYDNSVPIKTW